MRKPPDTDQGPTWAPQSVIESTSYLVRRQLGRGGTGSVYEVQHRGPLAGRCHAAGDSACLRLALEFLQHEGAP
ncbi:MAG TPA: hypothetical protein VFS43_30420 [Polyangiaceae bacterium]|nr:hypothetical protein [Polyangiaceae bacterium]